MLLTVLEGSLALSLYDVRMHRYMYNWVNFYLSLRPHPPNAGMAAADMIELYGDALALLKR